MPEACFQHDPEADALAEAIRDLRRGDPFGIADILDCVSDSGMTGESNGSPV